MHAGAAHAQQMNPMSAAHHSFHTPPRPTHSPQQMAQTVMSMEEHAMYGDDSASRKRSKVSRACDECRRKKVYGGMARHQFHSLHLPDPMRRDQREWPGGLLQL
jgi:hypothetical protein